MSKSIDIILQETISGARVCAQPQVTEAFAKSALLSIADRLTDVRAQLQDAPQAQGGA